MDASTPRLGPRFRAALVYAAEAHAEQVRKGGRELPYAGHLLGVASLVIEDGGDEDEVIAALLHDAPEDQGGEPRLEDIRKRFGVRVAEIVSGCSDTFHDPKPPWRQRKERYLAHLELADPSVLRVSVADKVHNLGTTVSDVRLDGPAVWERFNAKAEEQLWYYGSLLDVLRRRDASPRLVPELDRLLTELIGLMLASSPRALVIRPMRPSERGRVEVLGTPSLLAERMEQHAAGVISFLVGWIGEEPVGHVLVRWQTDSPKYEALPPGAPILEWLGVAEGHRDQGIGTALMDAAEWMARARGHDQLLLAVGVENRAARRLYGRRGYAELPLDPQYLSWTFLDADGIEQAEGEWVTWWAKELAAPRAAHEAHLPDD